MGGRASSPLLQLRRPSLSRCVSYAGLGVLLCVALTAATPLTTHDFFESVEGIVALSTIALAVGTAGLAGATMIAARAARDEVLAVKEQVQVERGVVASTFRPLLVNAPPGYTVRGHPGDPEIFGLRTLLTVRDEEGRTRISLPVRNAGVGAAFVQNVTLQWKGQLFEGRAGNAIITTDHSDVTILRIDIPSDATLASPTEERSFVIRVAYDDLSRASWQSDFNIRWRERSGGWNIANVEYRRLGASDDEAVRSGDMLEE
jgi:hypothetical protein